MRWPQTLLLAGVIGTSAAAQSFRYVPSYAATRDGPTLSLYPFQPFNTQAHYRTQHLIEGAAFCQTVAILTGFSYRTAGWWGLHGPHRFDKLTLSVGHTKKTANTMSLTWAENRSEPQVPVLTGSYHLPSVTKTKGAGPWGIVNFPFAKPFLYQRASGNLLIEFDIADIPSTYFNYALDADIEGGATVTYGPQGRFSDGQWSQAAINFQTRLRPGGQVEVLPYPMDKPGLALYGFSNQRFGSLKLPLDLTGFGAPGNWLHTSVDLVLPLLPRYNGLFYSAILPVPDLPVFGGTVLFAQSLHPDKAANGLGLVFSNCVEVHIGEKSSPMLQIWGYRNSPKAIMGFMGGGYTWRISTPGGPTTRLMGTFR